MRLTQQLGKLFLCGCIIWLWVLAMPVSAVTPSPQYTQDQAAFALSLLSNAVSDQLGTQQQLQEQLDQNIRSALDDPTVKNYIGDWQIGWGPVVYERPQSLVSNNTLYVAQRENTYVIATAGTNPISFYDWLVEDFDVTSQVDWPYPEFVPAGLQPKLAQGTSTGLQILLNMKSHDQTIIEFLDGVVKTHPDQSMELVVVGHSLGGALSPVLALALLDQQAQWTHNHPINNQQAKWLSTHPITLSVYPTAGATPGNKDFSTYYSDRLECNTIRVWNALDVVPYAWNEGLLKVIPYLYEFKIQPDDLLKQWVKVAEENAASGNYTQLIPDTRSRLSAVDLPVPATPQCQRSNVLMAPPDLDTVATQIAFKLSPALTEAAVNDPSKAPKLFTFLYENQDQRLTVLDQESEVQRQLQAEVKTFLTFLEQAAYQHTTRYSELYGIDDLTTYMTQQCYLGKTLDPSELLSEAIVVSLEKLICNLIFEATEICPCGGCTPLGDLLAKVD